MVDRNNGNGWKVDDFGGKLPTLDLNIWVDENNVVMYIFYQKPMANSMMIQKR